MFVAPFAVAVGVETLAEATASDARFLAGRRRPSRGGQLIVRGPFGDRGALATIVAAALCQQLFSAIRFQVCGGGPKYEVLRGSRCSRSAQALDAAGVT